MAKRQFRHDLSKLTSHPESYFGNTYTIITSDRKVRLVVILALTDQMVLVKNTFGHKINIPLPDIDEIWSDQPVETS